MKKLILIITVLIAAKAKGQAFTEFNWSGISTTFSTVKMKVSTEDKKVIFNGFKDAKIEIILTFRLQN